MGTSSDEVVARLVIDGDNVYNLKTGSYLIGNASSKDCVHDIGVNDPSLDVKHAVIVVSPESTQLMDLFSRHGTYIEGRRVKQFEVVDLTKPVKLQFGCIISHYQPCHESDSGFLGLNDSAAKDTSIVPNTPPSRNESLTRSNKTGNSCSSSTLLIKPPRSSLSARETDSDESFIVKATQASNEYGLKHNTSTRRSNLSHFEEDDDFFIPETQEVNLKNGPDNQLDDDLEVNDSCDMFQLNTQDFNEPDDCSNDSDNLIAHVSCNDPVAIPVAKPCKQATPSEKTASSDQSPKKANNEDSDTDCEEEIMNLRLNETDKSGKSLMEMEQDKDSRSSIPTPDINPNQQVNDEDDLELTQAFIDPNKNEIMNLRLNETDKSGKSLMEMEQDKDSRSSIPTPDINPNQQVNDEDDLELTQAFIDPNKNDSIKRNTSRLSRPADDSFADLDKTQAFVVPAASTSKIYDENSNDSESLDQTQIFHAPPQRSSHSFSIPCIDKFDKARRSAKKTPIFQKHTEDLEPTQIFRPPAIHETSIETAGKISLEKSVDKSKELNELEATQKFVVPIAANETSKEPNDHEATQKFIAPNAANGVSKEPKDLDATQKFIAPNATVINNRRKSKSPVLLDSDEEEHDSEFCFAETMLVGEEVKPNLASSKENSAKKSKIMNKLFGSDDEEEVRLNEQTPPNQIKKEIQLDNGGIQPTPDFQFFKLPGVKKLDVAGAIYRAKVNSMARCKTLLEESSDEEDENDPVKVMNRLLTESEVTHTTDSKQTKVKLPAKKEKSPAKKEIESRGKRSSRKESSSSSTSTNKKDDKNEKQSSKQTKVGKKLAEKTSNDAKAIEKGNESHTKSESAKIIEKDKESHKKSEHKRNTSPVKNSTTEKERKLPKRSDIEIKEEKSTSQKRETRQKNDKTKTDKKDKSEKPKMDKESNTDDDKRHKTRSGADHKKSSKETKKTIEADENLPTNKIESMINANHKKRHHSTSKEETSIPRKKSKENDPSLIQPPIDGDVIVSLRKSNRSTKPRILFTKMDSKPHEKTIEKIGGMIVENPIECNILITNMVYRTWKFLSAMGKGVPIVTTKWLNDALSSKEKNGGGVLPNFDDYLVKDNESEKRFKFTLKKSLDRARQSQIFNGYTFHCTPNTKPVPKELQTIIECAGGKVLKKLPKDFVKPDKFYIVSDKRDINMWMDIRTQIGDVYILSTEAVLIAVMQQSINFKMYLLAS